MIYPWQNQAWQQFHSMREANRLPHAILLTGMPGLGYEEFAEAVAKSLLCSQPAANGMACEQCHLCQLSRAGTHPDIRKLQPEKEGQAIKVDEVREINDFAQQSSLQNNARVVIINPANQLNHNAANALLKTLEEPTEGAYLILISHQIRGLLPTIVSRCQRITLHKPANEQASQWLQQHLPAHHDAALLLRLAQGMPLCALQLVDNGFLEARKKLYTALVEIINQQGDLLKTAADFKEASGLHFIDLLMSWLSDIMRLQLGVQQITNDDYAQSLSSIADKTQMNCHMKLMNYLVKLRKILLAGVSINKQMMVESSLIHWCECK